MMKIFTATALLVLLLTGNPVGDQEMLMPTKTEQSQQQKPSLQEVKAKIEELGLKYPRIVLAQVREESGNLTSNLYSEHQNLLGMKYPAQRETTAIGKTNSGFAIYKSWEYSLMDYKILQDTYYKDLTRQQYIRKLRKVYSRNPKYLENYLEL